MFIPYGYNLKGGTFFFLEIFILVHSRCWSLIGLVVAWFNAHTPAGKVGDAHALLLVRLRLLLAPVEQPLLSALALPVLRDVDGPDADAKWGHFNEV